jgi:ubiquitin C-terminal hydrolase
VEYAKLMATSVEISHLMDALIVTSNGRLQQKRHEDANDLLHILFDQLVREMYDNVSDTSMTKILTGTREDLEIFLTQGRSLTNNNNNNKESDIVTNTFGGWVKQSLIVPKHEECPCYQSDSFTRSEIIEVTIPLDPKWNTLEKCLEYTFENEQVEWKCDQCKKAMKGERKQALVAMHLPETLVINLVRFRNGNRKIDKFVSLPNHYLNLEPFCDDMRNSDTIMEYDLIAVVNHIGTTKRGHYTVYAREPKETSKSTATVTSSSSSTSSSTVGTETNNETEWIVYDDTTVTPLNKKNEVVGKDAYMLFFQKRTAMPKPVTATTTTTTTAATTSTSTTTAATTSTTAATSTATTTTTATTATMSKEDK